MMLTLWEWKNVHEPPAPVSPVVPGGMVVSPRRTQTKYLSEKQQQVHVYQRSYEQERFGPKLGKTRDKQSRQHTNKASGCVLIDSPRDEGIQFRKELFDYQEKNRGRFSRDLLPITPQRNFRCKHSPGINVTQTQGSSNSSANDIPTLMSYDHNLYIENGDYREKVEKMKRVYELMQGVDRKYSYSKSPASVRTNTASAKTPPKKSLHDSLDSGFDSDVDKGLLNTVISDASPDSEISDTFQNTNNEIDPETQNSNGVPQTRGQGISIHEPSEKLNDTGNNNELAVQTHCSLSPHSTGKLPQIKRSKSKKRVKTKSEELSEEVTSHEAGHLPYVSLPSLEAVRAGKPNPGKVSAFSLIDEKSYSKFARKSKPKKSNLGQAVQDMRPVYDRLMPVDSQKMATVSPLYKKSSKKKT